MPSATREYPLFIGGEWKSGRTTRTIRNPYDGSAVGMVHQAAPEHLEQAVQAAQEAFETTRRMQPYERMDILARVVQGLSDRKEEIAQVLAREAGKPIRLARGEVERSLFTFGVAREEAGRLGGEVLPLALSAAARSREGLTKRFPLGPILAISPFNFPSNLVVHKWAPALACGNTVVHKPASQTPVTSLLLAEVLHEAGVPPGQVNVVPCPASVVEPLVSDDRLRMVTFTGSAAVGWGIKARAGKKKVCLEMGGNAAAVVDAGVDLARVVPRLVVGSYAYAGQICIKVQRIYVHQDRFEEFSGRFVEEVKHRLGTGDPLDEHTICGPLISESEAERVEAWVEEAVAGGARLLCGGQRRGTFYEPTVLTDVVSQMKVSCQEVFGPVTVLAPFSDFEEALQEVNRSEYGLQAGVFTHRLHHAFQAFDELEVGAVIINDYPTFRIDHMPYGGVKNSGLGREGIRYALEEMTELRLLVLNRDF